MSTVIEEKSVNSPSPKAEGPVSVLGKGIKNYILSFAGIGKNIKYLIPALILVVIWLVTDILKVCNVSPQFVRIIRAITFADAGTSTNPINFIGGVIGKGIYATALYIPINLISKKNSASNVSFIKNVSQSFSFNKEAVFIWLLGLGIAPFIFIFMAGHLSVMSVGGGAAACIVAAKNAVSGGFLSRFVNSFVLKCKKLAPEVITKNLMSGMAAGMALATILGIYLSDKVMMIAALVISLIALAMIILSAVGVVKISGKKEVQS